MTNDVSVVSIVEVDIRVWRTMIVVSNGFLAVVNGDILIVVGCESNMKSEA